jgi:hypothetical protein
MSLKQLLAFVIYAYIFINKVKKFKSKLSLFGLNRRGWTRRTGP